MFILIQVSELEGYWSSLEVLRLRELVLECLQELGVHFIGKWFYVFYCWTQFLLLKTCPLLHLFVPDTHFFHCFTSEYECGCGKFRLLVLEEGGVKQRYFIDVLGEEEQLLVILSHRGNLSETLQETERTWIHKVELKGAQNFAFHFEDILLCELILRDTEEIL